MTPSLGRLATLLLSGGLLLPTQGDAQTRTTFAVDLSRGKATGNGGPYEHRDMTNFRLAVSGRTGRDSAIAFFWEASAAATMHSICKPWGSCPGDYPELVGLGLTLGGLVHPRRNVEFRFGAGGTMYGVTNLNYPVHCPNSYGSCRHTDNATLALMAQSDVAFFPV